MRSLYKIIGVLLLSILMYACSSSPLKNGANIDYGMDVNYKLFNYFQFAQQKYKMRLDGGLGAPVRIR